MQDPGGVRAALEEAGRQAAGPVQGAPAASGAGGGRAATGWARTAAGWALNLDGSDASTVFSLPRLEVHPSVRGWRSLCLLQDGTRHERLGRPSDSVHVAMADAESVWRGLS